MNSAHTASPGLQFSIARIPVRIQLAFFLIPLFALQTRGVQGTVIWTATVFFSILAHELGHGLAMRAYGFEPTIVMQMFGGVTIWPSHASPSARQRLWVTAAGPATSLTLGLVVLIASWNVGEVPPPVEMAMSDLKWVNLFWSFINLLPMLPFDGGLILDSFAELVLKQPRARWVGAVSLVTGIAVIAGSLWLGWFLLAIIAVESVLFGYRRIRDGGFDQHLSHMWQLFQSGQHAKAEVEANTLLAQTKNETQRDTIFEALAWIRLMQRDIAGAKQALREIKTAVVSPELSARMAAAENDIPRVIDVLLPLQDELSAEDLTLLFSALAADGRARDVVSILKKRIEAGMPLEPCASAAALRLAQDGAFDHSFEINKISFEKSADSRHAFNAACNLVRLGRHDDAIAWLGHAVAGKYKTKEAILHDDDLKPLHPRADFQRLVGQL